MAFKRSDYITQLGEFAKNTGDVTQYKSAPTTPEHGAQAFFCNKSMPQELNYKMAAPYM